MNRVDRTLRLIISNLAPWQKTFVVFLHDIIITFLSFIIACYVKIDTLSFSSLDSTFFIYLSIVVLIKSIIFYYSDLYKGIWRYSSTPDLLRIIKATTIAVLISFIALSFTTNLEYISPSVFFIDWLFLIVSLGGSRFAYRIWRDQYGKMKLADAKNNIIIVGAGDGGEKLFREIKNSASFDVNVLAFVDDDLGKRSKSLHGVPVMGGVADIPQIVKKVKATGIYIAIPSATSKEFRRIIEVCADTNIKIKTLPKMKDILERSAGITELRQVKPEDLLGRKEVKLDEDNLASMINNKIVAVTGAGGSIGSELCRQIAKFKPKELVLIEITEFNLYKLEQDLQEEFPKLHITSLIADVRKETRIDDIFQKYRPEVVLHAAAYKHVPMMEKNPLEAINTNVFGTEVVCKLASKYDVERFVLVSTDKAVNPTNVMGTTKRIAELIVQNFQDKTKKTKFMIVRFGNVLGSSGSVIPLFKSQIKKGGPLTVTHPEITRYFMSIPEAAQLVIQAGSIGEGGEIFVLEMGEPFKIVDLAKQMITLAGFKKDDIKIKFTGLRPGEKLYEELLADQESTLPTCHEKVRIAKARPVFENFSEFLSELQSLNEDAKMQDVVKILKNGVPEFKHENF